MKKVFGQTVRDLKREVNKKVLKVPGIEQKVLDATSNEPWGPHGSHLADIAHATRNYHEYQMIMAVIWKRINDTGKNWRHVYKALTVLEYLVAHGSERVIDEIREHAYQISTLSDFQYIDSSGRDQGSNVRKKSQSLVVLVNDKERIQEVRQKAAANRDKFRNTSSTGGMYRPSSYSNTGGYGDRYEDDRYGSRDEDRNGYGREREWGSRDDDRNSRDGDRYGRDSEERYGRDGYRDDDYRGRSRSIDDYQFGSRSRSSDRDRDRAFDDDSHYSSRGSGARADDHSQDGRRLDRKFSEQNLGAPPSYEEAVTEAVTDARSPVHSERDGETSAASAPKGFSPPPVSTGPSQATTPAGTSASPANKEVDAFDEFDPRGSISATPAASNSAEMDLLGSLSESFSSNSLAIMPVTNSTTASEAEGPINSGSGPTFAATPSVSTAVNQPFEDPFGDSPFKAIGSTDSAPAYPQNFASTSSFQPTVNQISEPPQLVAPQVDTVSNFDFGSTFPGITYTPSSVNPQFMPQELLAPHQNTDILADILPPSGPPPPIASLTAFPTPTGHPAQPSANALGSFLPQGSTALVASHMAPQTPTGPAAQHYSGNFLPQSGSAAPVASQVAFQTSTGPAAQHYSGNFLPQSGYAAPVASQVAFQTSTRPAAQHNIDVLGNLVPQAGPTTPMASQPALPVSTGSLAVVTQPPKDKFETKSTVWADTLSRGLVNLNISGAKTNPLADIGIDFEAINRKEKRMEKPSAAPVTSNITMGKAMGSGSGVGRAGASALRAPPSPMMGSRVAMGMGGVPGAGINPGGYGGMSQQPMGIGMGMNMNMNMAMGQGLQMQPPTGLPPGSTVPGPYYPMMGQGGYAPQQPYGGGYR